jgi:hypothetical protein
MDRRYPAGRGEIVPVSRDQLGCLVHVARRQRMCDCLFSGPGSPVPAAGPPVQQRDEPGRGLRPNELAPQHLGEKSVVPVPDPVLIGRDQEQVLSL